MRERATAGATAHEPGWDDDGMSTADWYDDGLVRLDADGIHLARYYFPLGGSRHVPWSEVRGYELGPLPRWTGRYRLWGTHRLDWWFPLDHRRHRKSQMILLDVAGTRPVLTPDDVDAVRAVLDRMLPVAS